MSGIYQIDVAKNSSETINLEPYQGKVMLIVNTASKCGFTPQYEGLQALQEKYADRGFSVLGFPCNQFGHQEPGSDEEIAGFCSGRFGVTFPVFSKIDVNGDDTAPLYQHLKQEAPGILGSKSIKWNFTKFLINKEGKVVERFGPATKPEKLESAIEALL